MTGPVDVWTELQRRVLLGDGLTQLAAEVHRFNTETILATVDGAVAKVGHEAIEFVEKPSMDEARDVLITLLGWVRLAGHTERQLIEAALAKMEINHGRTWIRQPDGTYQHE